MFAFLTIVSLVLLVVHFSIHWSKKGRMINKFPGPSLFPVLGNALDLICTPKEMFAKDIKLAELYNTTFRFWTLHIPAIKLIDPDDIEVDLEIKYFIVLSVLPRGHTMPGKLITQTALLSSTNHKHTKKSFIYDFLRPWLNDGLLMSVGEKWHTRRKLLTPTFHFNILKQFCGIFQDECEKLVTRISKLEGEEIEIQPLMCRFALQTICETAMGTKLDAVSDRQSDDYMKSIETICDMALARFSKFWLISDWTFNRSSLGKFQAKLLTMLHKFTNDVVKTRRSSSERLNEVMTDEDSIGSKKRLAMLDLLLDAEKKGLIDEEGIREEVDTFMFEGHDTTMMALTFLLMEIANNPDIQDKIVAEISEIFSSPSEQISMEALNKMSYLEKCIKEGLRLYPSVPSFARTLQDDLLLKNQTIPNGTICYVHVFYVHRKKEIYPDPLTFDPERFSIENCSKRHPFAYIPFSAGQRNCIGQKFAMLEMKAAVASLLRTFRLEAVTRPEEIDFVTEIVLKCSNQIKVKFFKREHAF